MRIPLAAGHDKPYNEPFTSRIEDSGKSGLCHPDAKLPGRGDAEFVLRNVVVVSVPEGCPLVGPGLSAHEYGIVPAAAVATPIIPIVLSMPRANSPETVKARLGELGPWSLTKATIKGMLAR
ncbi:MAG: hypothetical protein JW720_09210 [Sedimentisphaerales bacterium]|nr:hypothetical protein [Sedimentisphaerales bacterium]